MLRIVIEVDGHACDADGVKESLAMELERYGDTRVVDVREIAPEQLKIER